MYLSDHSIESSIALLYHHLPLLSFLQPSKADFHAAFDVVFVDPSGHLNLCTEMTGAQYRRVSQQYL